MFFFQVEQNSSQILVVETSVLNYEALHHPTFPLTVEVADNGSPSLSFNKTFAITITDINEPPTNITISSDRILETAKIGQVIGKLNANNPEVNQTVIFNVLQVDKNSTDAKFDMVVNSTGSYLVLSQEPQDEWLGSYEVDLNVTDTGLPPPFVTASIRVHTVWTDPCTTGALQCDIKADCRRRNSTHGVCICTVGFTGNGLSCQQIDNCQVPTQSQTADSSQPITEGQPLTPVCLNNATCINGINTFTCVCPFGYTGTFCETEIDLCTGLSSPHCLNGGTCYSMLATRRCTCPTGFSGEICEQNVNDCSPNPCMKGTCIDGVNSYSCMCEEGYTGENCNYLDDVCLGSPCAENEICVPTPQGDSVGSDVAGTTSEENNDDLPEEESYYSCVGKSEFTFDSFNKTFNEQLRSTWKSIIEQSSFPDPNGGENTVPATEIYLLPGIVEGNGLIYVVYVGNTIVKPSDVWEAINRTCKNASHIAELSELCASRKEPSTASAYAGESPMTNSSPLDITWLIWVVVGVVSVVVIAGIVWKLARWRGSRKVHDNLQSPIVQNNLAGKYIKDADDAQSVETACFETQRNRPLPSMTHPQAVGDNQQLNAVNPLFDAYNAAVENGGNPNIAYSEDDDIISLVSSRHGRTSCMQMAKDMEHPGESRSDQKQFVRLPDGK